MSDTTTTPNSTPAPGETPTPKRHKSLVSKKDLADIKLGRDVAAAAERAEFKPTLIDPDKGAVDPALAAAIIADTNEGEQVKAPAIYDLEAIKETKTDIEEKAYDDMMLFVRKMQDGVRRKFPNDAVKQAAYFIGTKVLSRERASLEVQVQSMLDKAATDDLPGVTPAVLTAAAARLAAWIAADDEQRKAENNVATAYAAFRVLVDSILARTREIRLAANSCWPYTNPANVTTRRIFELPPDRPYIG